MDLDFEKDIILENNRVLIRPMSLEDYGHLLPIAAEDRELAKFSPSQFYTPGLLSKYVSKAIDDRKNKLRYPFVIYDKAANTYAGSTSYLNVSNPDRRIEIGWTWLGNEFQKTGLNRNCKYLLMEYAFDQLGFERVELKTDERNIKSRTAIEKIGGKFEGILRSHTVMTDGFRRNTVYYSILKEEWPEIKKQLEK
jgi:RimJ/RimL family protein N-acetyltransferase